MFKKIESPADCEIRSVIRFLSSRNLAAAEIHHQICEVYGDNAMSDNKVRKWVRMFKDGRVNVHDEPCPGPSSLISEDLVRDVDNKIREGRRFMISTLSIESPQISRSVLYTIVSEKLNYRKLCSRWVPRLLSDDHETKRLDSALSFLTRYDHPHSPDLALSDFHLFRYLKEFLGGQRFNDDEEVKTAVVDWASSQAADFFDGLKPGLHITVICDIIVKLKAKLTKLPVLERSIGQKQD
ncbi:protein GVQW3-like [Centruroides vittatus]|uniref:protein GVQW3-like n=1 Tax=Centruroides vittatus TaxID=120091 RepID=UPI00350FE254